MLYKLSFKEEAFSVFILRIMCVFAQIYLDVYMYILQIYLFEAIINVESSAIFMFWEESIFIFRVVH